MEHKKSKLTLRYIDESTGTPFIKKIRSLDEVTETGNYTVVARNVSPECGFPKIATLSEENICCEATLQVSIIYADNLHSGNRIYGQQLIIPNEEGCDIYVRKLTSKGAGKWHQLATEVVNPTNNDAHIMFAALSAKIEQMSEQIRILNERCTDIANIKTWILNLLLEIFGSPIDCIKQIKQMQYQNNASVSIVP